MYGSKSMEKYACPPVRARDTEVICPQVRAVPVDDKSAAVETVTREKATSDPGSVGAPMSGVVVEVRVKEGHEVKRGDIISILSAMKVRVAAHPSGNDSAHCCIQMESAVSAPVSGHIKRVLIHEGTLFLWSLD